MNVYPDSFSKFIFWLFVTFDILLGRYVCWNRIHYKAMIHLLK